MHLYDVSVRAMVSLHWWDTHGGFFVASHETFDAHVKWDLLSVGSVCVDVSLEVERQALHPQTCRLSLH